jgi:4-hydroxy-tetrahydrodipicolinate synthase
VDPVAFGRVARFAIDAGAAGLVIFGLAGEVSRLTTGERELLLEALVAAVGTSVPILVGATAESTAESRRLARHASAAGAAGVVLPPPTAYSLAEAEHVEFFAEVASATELAVIVQDAPEFLSVSLRPEAVVAASERSPNICGVKLEAPAEGIERWRAALGPSFRVYGGNGGVYLLDCIRAGADGVMPGVDTVDLQVEIDRLERAGRGEEAEELFGRLLPMLVFEMQDIDHYNLCAKHVLRRRGIDVRPELRPPAPAALSPASLERLDHYLGRLDLPVAGAEPVTG